MCIEYNYYVQDNKNICKFNSKCIPIYDMQFDRRLLSVLIIILLDMNLYFVNDLCKYYFNEWQRLSIFMQVCGPDFRDNTVLDQYKGYFSMTAEVFKLLNLKWYNYKLFMKWSYCDAPWLSKTDWFVSNERIRRMHVEQSCLQSGCCSNIFDK
jgi:hypothetical protein